MTHGASFRKITQLGLLLAWAGLAAAAAAAPLEDGGGSKQPTLSSPQTSATQTSATARVGGLSPTEEKWGIKILNLRHTARGYMIAFRFRVLDADKAAGLFKREDRPILIDQATNAQFIVPTPPKVGALRSAGIKPTANRNYYMLFANPGIFVKRGNKVTLIVGKFKVTDLSVE